MKKWQFYLKISKKFRKSCPEVNPVVLQLLFNRGLTEALAVRSFLSDALPSALSLAIGAKAADFYDPFLFKNMAAAVDLIIEHIKSGRRLVVYGDYDADGVTASVILSETLKILHAEVDVYLPDRVSEGYGLNKAAIEQIVSRGGKLLITVDNGIRNKEEVIYAQSLGLEVIITDHHVLPEVKEDLPPCLYIDPADPEEKYPWPYLAGVGVAFKLVSALLLKADLPDRQKELISEKCLDLVAVGTIADLVSVLGENRILIKRGLAVLNRGRRLGLEELIKAAKINNGRPLAAWNVSWQIGPRLNAASRLGHANSAFALLTTTNAEAAKSLAQELNQRNLSRQQITEEITAQMEAQIDPEHLPLLIIGVAGEDQFWNEGVIGLVAGRVAEKYYRPTLIITRLIEEAELDPLSKKLVPKKVIFKGSGRSIPEFNLIAALEDNAEFLDKYGGHFMAVGFSIKEETQLDKFKAHFLELAEKSLAGADLRPKLKIEAELKWADLNLELAEAVNALAPFGQNNPVPRFASFNLRLDDIVTMGFDNQHIKFRLSNAEGNGGASFWALAFGAAEQYRAFKIGDHIDLAYNLEINEYNGRREVQLKIVDVKLRE